MNIIRCNALKCAYNKNNGCIKIHVEIDGTECNALDGSSYPRCYSISDMIDLSLEDKLIEHLDS